MELLEDIPDEPCESDEVDEEIEVEDEDVKYSLEL